MAKTNTPIAMLGAIRDWCIEKFFPNSSVNISNPSNGQVLKYNSTSRKWENANESGGGGATSLNDLSDVTISSPDSNDLLMYDQVLGWRNSSLSLQGLADVDKTAFPQNNQILKYDATNHKWIFGNGGSGGASELDDLSDVSLTSPQNGEIMRFDDNLEEWINTALPGLDLDVLKRYFYTKEEIFKIIEDLPISGDALPYEIYFIGGTPDSYVTLKKDEYPIPQSGITIQLDKYGTYTGIFYYPQSTNIICVDSNDNVLAYASLDSAREVIINLGGDYIQATPPMTSDNTPYNSVDYYTFDESHPSSHMAHFNDGYKFFDNDYSSHPEKNFGYFYVNTNNYVKYTFDEPTIIAKVDIEKSYEANWYYKLEGSYDDNVYIDLTGWFRGTPSGFPQATIPNPQPFKYYKIRWQQRRSDGSIRDGSDPSDDAMYYCQQVYGIKLFKPGQSS